MREWACWCVGASVHHKGGTGTATRVRNHEYMCMDVQHCVSPIQGMLRLTCSEAEGVIDIQVTGPQAVC